MMKKNKTHLGVITLVYKDKLYPVHRELILEDHNGKPYTGYVVHNGEILFTANQGFTTMNEFMRFVEERIEDLDDL